ncbi:unnamed protein product [Cochlearia groenlandica]
MSSILNEIKNLARRLSPLARIVYASSSSSLLPTMAARSSHMQTQSEAMEGLDDILRRGNNNKDFGSESSNEVNPPSLNQNDQAIVPQKESNQPQEPVVENRTDAPAQPSTRREGKAPIVEIPSSSLSSSSWSPSVKNHIEESSIRPK